MTDVKMKAMGKEFNEISNEVEQFYFRWIEQSNLLEQELFSVLKNEKISVHVADTLSMNGYVNVSLCANGEVIGEPFLFITENISDKEKINNFYMDISLIFMLIASKSGDGNIYENMRVEVKENVIDRIVK